MNPEVAVVGGGPAGIATAIQLKRYDLEPLLFEKDRLGGLLWNAHRVENYPGFPKGIPGPGLIERFKSQLEFNQVSVVYEKVNTIDYDKSKQAFSLLTGSGAYSADIVVAATGTKPKTAGLLESVPEKLKEKLFFEISPIINGNTKEKEKKIIIIGAGDIAFDYALNLAGFNEVIIIHRSTEIKALPLLKRKIQGNKNIRFIGSSTLEKVEKGKSKALNAAFVKNGKDCMTMEVDYIVGAIGREPQRDFYTDNLWDMEEYLVSRGRLYFAGDVKNDHFRQVAIAVGSGIETAMKIQQKWLISQVE